MPRESSGVCVDLSFRKPPEIVGRPGGLGCCREDRPGIVRKQGNPVSDVTGVSELALDPKVGTEEGGGEFGDQLFGRVGSCAKPMTEVAIEPLLVARPVRIMPISA